MKKVVFDTNIILDIALKRKEYFSKASRLFELIDSNIIIAYVIATTITDIYYISRKNIGSEKALQFIADMIDVVEIIGIDKNVIINALSADIKDFEDAIQISAAQLNAVDCLITRNKKDFVKSDLEVFTPNEFLEMI